jgi:hypothetical protein
MLSASIQTRQVREATDIVALISEYIRLKPYGQGRMRGPCPFHADKTPSFTVSIPKQLYMCFGCSAGGDVYRFLQRIEGISFREARERLAERAGIRLDAPTDPAAARRQQQYQQHLAIEAAAYWNYVRWRYQFRFELVMASAWMASDAADEDMYQRLARRAWRWGGIIRRLDGFGIEELMRKYRRVAGRLNVSVLVNGLLDAERSANDTWARILKAAAEGRVSAKQAWCITAGVRFATMNGRWHPDLPAAMEAEWHE